MPGERGFRGEYHDKPKRTYYEIFGLSPTATDEQIKAAYKKLVKENHPDRPENRSREEQFKDITEAYRVLSDPQQRQEYDLTFETDSSRSSSAREQPRKAEEPRQERTYRKPDPGFGAGFDFGNFDFGRGFGSGEDFAKSRSRPGSQQRRAPENEDDLEEEYSQRKAALDEVSRQLKEELEYLGRDPIGNHDKIRNFSAYASWRMDEAIKNATQRGHRASSTPPPRDSSTRQSPPRPESKSTPRPEQKTQQSQDRLTIKKGSYYTNLVDERGRSVSSSYKDIQKKGRYFVGTNIADYQYLIDPNTGKELSSSYKQIDVVGNFIVATDVIGNQRLLDRNTGRDLTRSSYKKITIEGGFPIGSSIADYQRLIDGNTGQELGSSYKSIVLRGDLLIGTSISGYECLLDKKTGRELASSMYKRIERRGGKIIGHRSYGEEEIKVNNY